MLIRIFSNITLNYTFVQLKVTQLYNFMKTSKAKAAFQVKSKPRVDAVKTALHEIGLFQYMEDYLRLNPEDNNRVGINRVRNVMSLRVVHVPTLIKLEKFVKTMQRLFEHA